MNLPIITEMVIIRHGLTTDVTHHCATCTCHFIASTCFNESLFTTVTYSKKENNQRKIIWASRYCTDPICFDQNFDSLLGSLRLGLCFSKT